MKMIFKIIDAVSKSGIRIQEMSCDWSDKWSVSLFCSEHVIGSFPAGWPCAFSSSWSLNKELYYSEAES